MTLQPRKRPGIFWQAAEMTSDHHACSLTPFSLRICGFCTSTACKIVAGRNINSILFFFPFLFFFLFFYERTLGLVLTQSLQQFNSTHARNLSLLALFVVHLLVFCAFLAGFFCFLVFYFFFRFFPNFFLLLYLFILIPL